MSERITKVYALAGVAQCSLLFPIMGTKIRVNFTDGTMDAFGQCPAKAEISAPLVQLAIEQSQLFKDGKITLLSTRGSEARSATSLQEYPNVNNTQAARNVLMLRYGIPIERLKDKASVLSEAGRVGVSFPNLSLSRGGGGRTDAVME